MNNPVEAARARLLAIEEEAEKLRLFIIAYEGVADYIGGAAKPHVGDPPPVDNPAEGTTAAPKKKPRATNPPSAVLIRAVIDTLNRRGHPLSRKGLFDALKDRGLVVQGADPVKTLGTILWRNRDKIIQIEDHGYWPRATPYHRANYLGDGAFKPYTLGR